MNKLIKIIFNFVVFVVVGLSLQAMDVEHENLAQENTIQELEALLSSTADTSSSISSHKKFLPSRDYKKLGEDRVVGPASYWLASSPQSAPHTLECKKTVCSVGTSPEEKGSPNAKKMRHLKVKNECLARLVDSCDNFIAIIASMRRQIKNSTKTHSACEFQAFDSSSDSDYEDMELSTFGNGYSSNDSEDDCETLLLDIVLIKRDVVTVRRESLIQKDLLLPKPSPFSLLGSNEDEIDSKGSVVKESDNIGYAIELLDEAMQSIEEVSKLKDCSRVDNAKKLGYLAVALGSFNKLSKITNLSSFFPPISSSSIAMKIFHQNTFSYLPA